MSTDALAQVAEETEVIEQEKAPEKPLEKAADPFISKASEIGWTDKDQWVEAGKDPDQWVDAKEFISRKPLFDRLHKQERALREKDARIEAVSQHAAKVEEMTRKRVIAELEAKRDQAVEVGDVAAFKQADKEIREAEQEFKTEPAKIEPSIPTEIQEFAKRHEKWFDKDEDMTDYAMARAKKYSDQGISLKDFLPKVEDDVKRAFSHKFANPNKDKPAAVSSNNGERRGKSFGYADLDDGQKAVWASLKKSGMTLDKFITDLKELGELK